MQVTDVSPAAFKINYFISNIIEYKKKIIVRPIELFSNIIKKRKLLLLLIYCCIIKLPALKPIDWIYIESINMETPDNFNAVFNGRGFFSTRRKESVLL